MDRNEILGAVFALLIVIGGIIGYNYIENRDGVDMANAGLEQCPKTPTWNNSGNIWVKDCGKYVQEWKKVQDKD